METGKMANFEKINIGNIDIDELSLLINALNEVIYDDITLLGHPEIIAKRINLRDNLRSIKEDLYSY